MILLIDNYDSFTYNVIQAFLVLGADISVYQNDEYTPQNTIDFDALIISPGPDHPKNSGVSIPLIKQYHTHKPVLGICLGHQAIGAAFGAEITRIDPPVHGKLSTVIRSCSNAVATDIFALCPDEFPVTRYHSLVVDEASLPSCLTVTARTPAGVIMGLSHQTAELHGVQFHPESIASVAGYRILAKFLEICGHPVTSGDTFDQLESQVIRLDQRFPDQMHP